MCAGAEGRASPGRQGTCIRWVSEASCEMRLADVRPSSATLDADSDIVSGSAGKEGSSLSCLVSLACWVSAVGRLAEAFAGSSVRASVSDCCLLVFEERAASA